MVKIRTKLIIILVIVGFIPFLLIGVISLNIAKSALTKQAFAQLEGIRDTRKAQILRYFDKSNADITVLANGSHIINALDAFSSTLSGSSINQSEYDYFESLEYGDSFKKFIDEYGYYDIMLITLQGDIVYSLKKESDLSQNILTGSLSETPLGRHFHEGIESVVITDFELYPISGNQPISFLISPIIYFGYTEGVIVLKLTTKVVNEIMMDRSGMGQTGEAFLVGPDKLMRSDSFLDPEYHSVQTSMVNPASGKIDTYATRQALSGNTGREIIKDYRGVKVISAYVPLNIHNTNYALIAKIDESEAFEDINNLRALFIIIGVFTILTILTISIIIANRFNKPIIMLTRASTEISAGKLDKEIGVDSNDELGILAHSFEIMRDSIRNNRDNLEETVANRTAEMQKNQARLNALIYALPDSTIILDDSGCYMEIYQREDITAKSGTLPGYSDFSNLIGKSIHEVFPVELAELIQTTITKAIETNIIQNAEFVLESSVGPRWYDALFSPMEISSKGKTEVVLVARDITDLKSAQRIAEEADRAKSDFLANMSHEIRTPMNAIIGLDSLLAKTHMNSKQQDYVDKIGSSAKNLLGIINDILDFSKIEAGKLEIENTEFVLNDVLGNLSSMIGDKTREKGLELVFDQDLNVPRFLIGDPLRIGQILLNLTNNAIKFTEKGEIVVISKLISTEEQITLLRFDIKDTGIGLTEDQINKLFQSFSQADTSTTRKYGGTGLGLSISKKLVELMGGEIGVVSEHGKGSTFYFTIRLGIGKGKEKLTTPEDLRGLRILVVDDNETARDVLISYLDDFKFQTKAVSSGKLALREIIQAKAAENKNYDVVLMDYQMPGLNGIETSKKIRDELENIEAPKIIMITGIGREEIMRQAEKVGLQGFLIKPVSPSMLFDMIMEVFGKSSFSKKKRIDSQEFKPVGFEEIRGAKLLLVEDNEINQQVAKETLELEGFNVDIAEDGRVGVEKLQKNISYDLVLMDLQMPVMDGYEATMAIRKDERFRELPIVAMTADAMIGVRDQVKKVGMNDYVTKPINPKELWEALAKWIKPGDRQLPDVFNQKTDKNDSEILIPEISGINVQIGLERVGRNKKLYINLLEQLRDNYGSTVKEIQRAIEENERETAIRLAHTLKSVSGNIGAEAIQLKAELVESALKENRESKDVLVSLENELSKIIENLVNAELSPHGDNIKGKSKGTIEPVILKKLLEDLQMALEKRKPKIAKETIESLNDYALPENTRSDIEEISSSINKYKFKEALSILNQM